MKTNHLSFALLALTLSACATEEDIPPPRVVVLADTPLQRFPGAGEDSTTYYAAFGDTLELLQDEVVPVTGSGREPTEQTWYQLRKGQHSGWVLSDRFALLGTISYAELRPPPELPPPPTLYQRLFRKEYAGLSEKVSEWWDHVYYDNVGTEAEQEHELFIEACDYTNPEVHHLAASLVTKKTDGPINAEQLATVYDFLRENWVYVSDPVDREYFAPASTTIATGYHGDCDDFTVAIFSLLSSIGGDLVLNVAYGENSAHAYAEIQLGSQREAVTIIDYLRLRYETSALGGYRIDSDGRVWLNLDWNDDYPGGRYFEAHTIRRYHIYVRAISTEYVAP